MVSAHARVRKEEAGLCLGRECEEQGQEVGEGQWK
jgi:hypothetical protein